MSAILGWLRISLHPKHTGLIEWYYYWLASLHFAIFWFDSVGCVGWSSHCYAFLVDNEQSHFWMKHCSVHEVSLSRVWWGLVQHDCDDVTVLQVYKTNAIWPWSCFESVSFSDSMMLIWCNYHGSHADSMKWQHVCLITMFKLFGFCDIDLVPLMVIIPWPACWLQKVAICLFADYTTRRQCDGSMGVQPSLWRSKVAHCYRRLRHV